MWGIRVIVPNKLQDKVISELHREHPGVVQMKSFARSYVWWPGLDQAIERVVKACSQCQVVKNTAPVAPLHPWIWPAQPWQRVHIDFAGPFMGKSFLLVVDAHFKWSEVWEMKSITAAKTIEVLRQLFSSYGLPEQVVSDNGPQFTADEFTEFMKVNGIKHIRSTPYHPSTNGLVERFVQTFKRAMRAGESEGNQCIIDWPISYLPTEVRRMQLPMWHQVTYFFLKGIYAPGLTCGGQTGTEKSAPNKPCIQEGT